MKFEGNKEIRLYSGENELIISGSRGRIRVNRGGLTGKPVEELTEKDNDWMQEEILKLCHGKKPGSHMQNFFDCVKDGRHADLRRVVAPPFGQRLPPGQHRACGSGAS